MADDYPKGLDRFNGLELLCGKELVGDLDVSQQWYATEKLDGMRVFTDGNTLWTRGKKASGVRIAIRSMPPSFLGDDIRKLLGNHFLLDGELYAGKGQFEKLSKVITSKVLKEAEFKEFKLMVFDLIQYTWKILPSQDGWEHVIHKEKYTDRVIRMMEFVKKSTDHQIECVPCHKVPSMDFLKKHVALIKASGGEGIMLRKNDGTYQDKNSVKKYKLKSHGVAEFITIKKRALVVKLLSGTTFAFKHYNHKLERCSPGDLISFRYNLLTGKNGVPKSAYAHDVGIASTVRMDAEAVPSGEFLYDWEGLPEELFEVPKLKHQIVAQSKHIEKMKDLFFKHILGYKLTEEILKSSKFIDGCIQWKAWLTDDMFVFVFSMFTHCAIKMRSKCILVEPIVVANVEIARIGGNASCALLDQFNANPNHTFFIALSNKWENGVMGSSHRSSLVFQKGVFFYLDSVGTHNLAAAKRLIAALEKISGKTFTLKHIQITQQANGWQCGWVVVYLAWCCVVGANWKGNCPTEESVIFLFRGYICNRWALLAGESAEREAARQTANRMAENTVRYQIPKVPSDVRKRSIQFGQLALCLSRKLYPHFGKWNGVQFMDLLDVARKNPMSDFLERRLSAKMLNLSPPLSDAEFTMMQKAELFYVYHAHVPCVDWVNGRSTRMPPNSPLHWNDLFLVADIKKFSIDGMAAAVIAWNEALDWVGSEPTGIPLPEFDQIPNIPVRVLVEAQFFGGALVAFTHKPTWENYFTFNQPPNEETKFNKDHLFEDVCVSLVNLIRSNALLPTTKCDSLRKDIPNMKLLQDKSTEESKRFAYGRDWYLKQSYNPRILPDREICEVKADEDKQLRKEWQSNWQDVSQFIFKEPNIKEYNLWMKEQTALRERLSGDELKEYNEQVVKAKKDKEKAWVIPLLNRSALTRPANLPLFDMAVEFAKYVQIQKRKGETRLEQLIKNFVPHSHACVVVDVDAFKVFLLQGEVKHDVPSKMRQMEFARYANTCLSLSTRRMQDLTKQEFDNVWLEFEDGWRVNWMDAPKAGFKVHKPSMKLYTVHRRDTPAYRPRKETSNAFVAEAEKVIKQQVAAMRVEAVENEMLAYSQIADLQNAADEDEATQIYEVSVAPLSSSSESEEEEKEPYKIIAEKVAAAAATVTPAAPSTPTDFLELSSSTAGKKHDPLSKLLDRFGLAVYDVTGTVTPTEHGHCAVNSIIAGVKTVPGTVPLVPTLQATKMLRNKVADYVSSALVTAPVAAALELTAICASLPVARYVSKIRTNQWFDTVELMAVAELLPSHELVVFTPKLFSDHSSQVNLTLPDFGFPNGTVHHFYSHNTNTPVALPKVLLLYIGNQHYLLMVPVAPLSSSSESEEEEKEPPKKKKRQPRMKKKDELYEVEEIVSYDTKTKLYLVKWKNYPSTDNSSIPRNQLLPGCKDLLAEFDAKHLPSKRKPVRTKSAPLPSTDPKKPKKIKYTPPTPATDPNVPKDEKESLHDWWDTGTDGKPLYSKSNVTFNNIAFKDMGHHIWFLDLEWHNTECRHISEIAMVSADGSQHFHRYVLYPHVLHENWQDLIDLKLVQGDPYDTDKDNGSHARSILTTLFDMFNMLKPGSIIFHYGTKDAFSIYEAINRGTANGDGDWTDLLFDTWRNKNIRFSDARDFIKTFWEQEKIPFLEHVMHRGKGANKQSAPLNQVYMAMFNKAILFKRTFGDTTVHDQIIDTDRSPVRMALFGPIINGNPLDKDDKHHFKLTYANDYWAESGLNHEMKCEFRQFGSMQPVWHTAHTDAIALRNIVAACLLYTASKDAIKPRVQSICDKCDEDRLVSIEDHVFFYLMTTLCNNKEVRFFRGCNLAMSSGSSFFLYKACHTNSLAHYMNTYNTGKWKIQQSKSAEVRLDGSDEDSDDDDLDDLGVVQLIAKPKLIPKDDPKSDQKGVAINHPSVPGAFLLMKPPGSKGSMSRAKAKCITNCINSGDNFSRESAVDSLHHNVHTYGDVPWYYLPVQTDKIRPKTQLLHCRHCVVLRDREKDSIVLKMYRFRKQTGEYKTVAEMKDELQDITLRFCKTCRHYYDPYNEDITDETKTFRVSHD